MWTLRVVQRKTNVYGIVLFAYLILNVLVMLSSCPYWLKKGFITYSLLNFVMIGTRSLENRTIMEPQINLPKEPIRKSSIKLNKFEMDQLMI